MTQLTIQGTVSPGFERAKEEFAAILATEGADLSAQFAAYHRGEKVVDLWAGDDSASDSLLGIYSASKGVTHLVVALLVQDGVLDLDERVAHYWPEFAVQGKGNVPLRDLLSHQAGLVGAVDGFTMEELADDHLVATRLGAQAPFWRPGSASGYHALVMAALSGEVVQRATGRSVQELFAERLRDPLGLDLHLGLPESEESRFLTAQPMVPTPERLAALGAASTSRSSLAGIAFNRHHLANREVWELPNLPFVRSRGTTSFGGIGTARGLAKLYSSMAVTTEGHDALLSQETLAAFGQIQSVGWDLVLRSHKAWAVGFHPVSEIYPTLAAGSFGHSGAGGQQAFVDPRNELSYGFLQRRFLLPSQADADHARLVAALTSAIGA